jgi:16S rRNA U1498 N3-methylase RsmE
LWAVLERANLRFDFAHRPEEFEGKIRPCIFSFFCQVLGRETCDLTVSNVLLTVGLEAGFTEDELSKAESAGIISVSLGTRRLRTETAGLVFLSLVLHHLEAVA